MERAGIYSHLKRVSGYKIDFPDSNASAITSIHGFREYFIDLWLLTQQFLTKELISQQNKCNASVIWVYRYSKIASLINSGMAWWRQLWHRLGNNTLKNWGSTIKDVVYALYQWPKHSISNIARKREFGKWFLLLMPNKLPNFCFLQLWALLV